MLFNSLEFLIFLPIVLLIYFILPGKIRYIWLLISSYYFYACWNYKHLLLLFVTTVITYVGGRLLEFCNTNIGEADRRAKRKKLIVTLGILSNLGILCYFKYTNFFIENVQALLSTAGIELKLSSIDVLLPVGISFFTFQALSYLIDVYRGDIYAEKNFLRYALFVSFFPQLVAGPIERSKNLLKQLSKPVNFCWENIKEGFWLMLYGFFLKVVLADRMAIYIDTVYGNYEKYQGIYLIVAALFFSLQLYCDFYGYSVIAMGTAKMMGYQLIDNFEAPFLSTSIEELWRRWHISLNTWFRDYLYIPLGGNKKGIFRQYINKIIVFFISGLWHGANWSFIIWGMLNGFYQMIGSMLKPVRNTCVKVLGLRRETFSHKLYQRIITFLLFSFSGIFFRAFTVEEAFGIIKNIGAVWNPWILFDGSLYQCGLEQKNFMVMVYSIVILLISDTCKYKKIRIREGLMKQEGWFRVVLAAGAILFILLLGIWGTSYDQTGFIYFQF